jgi:hypothetical protein
VVNLQYNSLTTAQQQVSDVVCQQLTFPRRCYFAIVHPVLILGDLEFLKFKLNIWQKTSLPKAFFLDIS